MRRPSAQLALAAVALVLGLLVVVQLRAQNTGNQLDALSAQDLSVLVANLNTRNDQLRTEIAGLQQEADDLQAAQSRGDSGLDQLRQDLGRVRGWAGLDAVEGMGVRLTVAGPLPGQAVEDILNELRNAGAEAISVGPVRVVPGSVVAGPPDGLSVEDSPLGDPFEIAAIGDPQVLTGTLTRADGVVAQLAATYPQATVTVTPVDRMLVPATDRSLVPVLARPRI
jgi:uncharacterized protein YlxW (UPF0749 family)